MEEVIVDGAAQGSPIARKEKKPAIDTRKQIWIITVAATKPTFPTHLMLHGRGIMADEWFYARDDDGTHIVIIHTPKPFSAERISNAMVELAFINKKDKTPSFTLAGYDMITASGGRGKKLRVEDPNLHIENNPFFKKIASVVKQVNAGDGDEENENGFQFWIDEHAGVFAFKKSLLLTTIPERKRKFIDSLTTEIERLKEENVQLKEENVQFKAGFEALQRL